MLNLFMILIPLREAFGILINDIPFRIGELLIPIFIIILFFKKNKNDDDLIKDKSIKLTGNKYTNIIIFMLLANFLLTVIVGFSNYNTIDTSFFYKYIVRNLLYFVFIFAVAKNIYKFNKIDFEKFIKYIIILELFFYILEFFNIYIYFSNIMSYSLKRVNIFGSIIRYCGTASEPGYLAPILVLPLYYFSMKENKKFIDYLYYFITIVLIVLTFSTFIYVIFALIVFIKYLLIFRQLNIKKMIMSIIVLLFIIIFSITIFSLTDNKVVETRELIINKITNFLFDDNNTGDYSSTTRKSNYQYAFNMFDASDVVSKIFGRGTGAYSYSVKNFKMYGILYEEAEEASNLYYSTLVDRGILGLIILIIEFYSILKLKVNKLESKTLIYGILTQMIQYYIVGNNWLYFFWLEIALLIYYNQKYCDKDVVGQYGNRN